MIQYAFRGRRIAMRMATRGVTPERLARELSSASVMVFSPGLIVSTLARSFATC